MTESAFRVEPATKAEAISEAERAIDRALAPKKLRLFKATRNEEYLL